MVAKCAIRNFLFFNVIGGVVWVSLFLLAGYFFGQIPVVQKNLKLLVLGIIVVSLLPVAIGLVKMKLKNPTPSEDHA